jgi:hypothetical protein
MRKRPATWVVVIILGLIAAVFIARVLRSPARLRGTASPLSTAEETRRSLFAEIQPVKVSNCELKRFGEAHDGGYLLCANLLGNVQAAYSYGISGYDGWGCDVSKTLHVAVHEYDCFDLRPPPCPGGIPMFHGECVGPTRETQEGRPFDSISSQMARNGDATRPVVMKMDVEGAEWDSFLLAPDSVFNHIDELDVEFHHVEDPKTVAVMQRLKQFFVLAHVHYNNFSCDPAMAPFPSWAFEVLLVNKRLATTDGSPAPHGPISLDAANNPQTPDCQAQ